MKVTLNLATRPFVDIGPAVKRLRLAMVALAVISLAALVTLHFVHSEAEARRAQVHSLDGSIARINAERQGYEAMMAQPRNAQFMTEVDELNNLFEEKAFSWTMAMESLETELPGGVQVTQIEPQRGKTGQITLHLRVVGPHDLSDELVKNLEHSKRFQSPRIVGEEAESANNPNQRNMPPVSVSNRFNFDVQTEYVPPTEDELAAALKKQKEMAAADKNNAEAAPAVAPPVAEPRPAAPQPVTPNPVSSMRQRPRGLPMRGSYPGASTPMPVTPDQQGQRTPYAGGPQ